MAKVKSAAYWKKQELKAKKAAKAGVVPEVVEVVETVVVTGSREDRALRSLRETRAKNALRKERKAQAERRSRMSPAQRKAAIERSREEQLDAKFGAPRVRQDSAELDRMERELVAASPKCTLANIYVRGSALQGGACSPR